MFSPSYLRVSERESVGFPNANIMAIKHEEYHINRDVYEEKEFFFNISTFTFELHAQIVKRGKAWIHPELIRGENYLCLFPEKVKIKEDDWDRLYKYLIQKGFCISDHPRGIRIGFHQYDGNNDNDNDVDVDVDVDVDDTQPTQHGESH